LGAAAAVQADYSSEVLGQKPLTYWRFNDAGTFTYPDNVATNSGTMGATNGVYSDQLAVKGKPGALAGTSNTSAGFTNASGDIGFIGNYVDVPFDASLNPNGPFTVEFWVKPSGVTPTDATGLSPIFAADVNNGRSGWLFYQTGAGAWNFRVGNSGGYVANISGGTVTTNWQHVAGVYDGSSVLLYVDGVLVAGPAAAAGFSPNGGGPIRIGGTTIPNRGFDGLVDEVALFPKQLTLAELAAHFSAAATNGAGYASQIRASQPALYLRLDESIISNPPAVNLGSLGTAANGTYLSSLMPGASGLVPPSFPGLESTNRDLVFDGVASEVSFNLPNVSVPWTATFWVNRQDALTASAVLLTSPSAGLKLEQWGTDRLVGFTAYGVADYNFNYGVPTNTWVQLTFVGTANGTLLYTNGFLADSNSATISLPLTRLGGAGDPPKMELDEAATFDRALLEGQIRTLYLTAVGDANPPGLVSDQPVVSPSGTIYATTPFSLSANVYGAGPLVFQWRKDGTVVGTTSDYAKAAASVADNGNYDVIVSNSHGAVTSAIVNLTINSAVPPTIIQPPADRPVYAGGSASFTVTASGTTPFTYQWKKNGANIGGATNQTLVITNVAAADAANYSVGVTNVAGGAVSAGAALSLRTAPANSYETAVVGSGPVAYYRFGETGGTNAFDYLGAHDGIYENVTLGLGGYSASDPNTSAGFDPTLPSAMVAASLTELSYTGPSPSFSLEAWVKFHDLTGIQRVFSKGGPGNRGIGFGVNTATGLRFTTYGVQDFDLTLTTPLTVDTWFHLAGVANAGTFYFYVNGELAGSVAFSGAATSATAPFTVGRNGLGATEPVNGQIDEVAVYTKALTAAEVAAHYAVVRYGTTTPPQITRQPAPLTATVGTSASFNVQCVGSVPLTYQWSKGGSPVSGATNSTLLLNNLAFTDAGSYAVKITNPAGFTNSAPTALTVMPVPTFANLTNNLVLHLKFDGDFKDSSGRANDAMAVGAPVLLSGKLGQGVELKTLTGGSVFNYLTVSDAQGDLSFGATDSFTISFWLKYDVGFNDLPILGNAINSTYQKGLTLSEDGGRFEWTAVGLDTGSIIADPAGGPLINDGVWHQMAVAFDRAAATAATYVDGRQIDTRSIAGLGTLAIGTTLTLGQDPTGGYGVNGTFDLDDFGIWRRALSSYEAQSIFNAAQNSGQSFDVYGPVKVTVNNSSSGVILAWQAGTLESTDALNTNPTQTVWTPVAGATAPTYVIPPGGGKKFYRVHL